MALRHHETAPLPPVPDGSVLPRLLKGLHADKTPMPLAEHLSYHGDLPAAVLESRSPLVVDEIARSGLMGRGGAAFPTFRKISTVAAKRGRRIVVANGAEGEPASSKDGILLSRVPHLVLDGVAVAAAAVGADRVIVATKPSCYDTVRKAAAAREKAGIDRIPPEIVAAPERFVAGEESALVDFLNGGPGLPQFVPPRVFEKGVEGRPTLMQNVETMAHLALIGRYGPDWFREIGTETDPGSTLVTVGGSLAQRGVYEVARGSSLSQLIAETGGSTEPVQAFLVGGYAGGWIPANRMDEATLSDDSLAALGGTFGAGILLAFPARSCGVSATAKILNYLAEETAGQCGPCVHGLAAIAETFQELAHFTASRGALVHLDRWASQVVGRGACHHPDGAVRLLDSALRTFAADIQAHDRQRRCLVSAAARRVRSSQGMVRR